MTLVGQGGLAVESAGTQGGKAMGKDEAGNGFLPWVIAAVVVVLLGVTAVWLGRGHGRGSAGGPEHARLAEGYGARLVMSGPVMSESTSLSGGKSTFIDGMVHNGGDQTVVGATVHVVFQGDGTMPPQEVMVPLTLIRTHEPYVDTEGLAVMPLRAGETREFRLIFEDVSANWNQQVPQMDVVRVFTACNPCG